MHFPDSTNHFRRLEAFPFSSVFADRQISFRVMKRRRKSTASNANGAGKVSHIQINYSGPSFSDLPNTILVNILLRLPIKRIFVCETLYDLISDPEFAKLHFDQAQMRRAEAAQRGES
ncbi:uncharacterized protein [Euphorbia lathyris]|uniref:uncharacterized protein isoform X3 n=1 Tax=Euphorbia lathyris TaxID=212925 RepID=UPI0033141E9A